MRYLVYDETSKGRVFGMFDCCRCPIQGMPALCGRGTEEEDDCKEEAADNTVCKYFHISACGPGGIADADGGFAKRLYDHCVKSSQRPPKGEMAFPGDWLPVSWAPGEIVHGGGGDYSLEFTPQ